MKKIAVILSVILSLGVVGGAIAYASIPASNGTINGCYKTSNGMLIVVDSSATCPSGYARLNWNQTGPQGPAGTNGTNGVSGYEIVHQQVTLPYNGSSSTTFQVDCPTGKQPLSGGYKLNPDASGGLGFVDSVYPSGAGWAFVIEPGSNSIKFPDLYVTCAVAN